MYRRDEIAIIRVLEAIEAAVAAEELHGEAYVAAHTAHSCVNFIHFSSISGILAIYIHCWRERERGGERDLRDKYLYGVEGRVVKETLRVGVCLYTCRKGIYN